MDVRDSLRGVRATTLKSTEGKGTPSITRKKETSGMSNLPVSTIGRDPNILYDIHYVFYVLKTLTGELSQLASGRTPSQPIKTEYMKYEFKQECH